MNTSILTLIQFESLIDKVSTSMVHFNYLMDADVEFIIAFFFITNQSYIRE